MEVHRHNANPIQNRKQDIRLHDSLRLINPGESPDTVIQPESVEDHNRHYRPVRHRPYIALHIFPRYT